jgi:hypothetical protein
MQDINSNITSTAHSDQKHEHHHYHHHQVNNFVVNDLMDQMTHKFRHVSKSILDRIDGMGERIESLEQSIDGLLETQGIDRIDGITTVHPTTTTTTTTTTACTPVGNDASPKPLFYNKNDANCATQDEE